MPSEVFYGDPDLIPIEQVKQEFGRSDSWLYNMLKIAEEGDLLDRRTGQPLVFARHPKFAGDKRTFLSRKQIDDVIRYSVQRKDWDEQQAQARPTA